MKQKKRLFYHIITVIITSFVVLLGVEAREYWKEDAERHAVKKRLEHAPANRNTLVTHEIQRTLEGKERFSFIVFGDTHQNFPLFTRILEHAERHNPDFALLTGDFTNEGTFNEYKKMLAFLDRIDVPLLTCPGNHDLRNYGIRCFSHMFGPLNFFFDLNGYRFIFLSNTERSVNKDLIQLPEDGYQFDLSRGMDKHLLSYLEDLLKDKMKTFIIMHIPPPVAPFDFYCFERNGPAFVELMSRHAKTIDVVFFGHIHGYGETMYNGVRYIEAGGAGKYREDINKKRTGLTIRHNYVLVTVSGSSVSHRVCFIDTL